jgi:hypothetical protein
VGTGDKKDDSKKARASSNTTFPLRYVDAGQFQYPSPISKTFSLCEHMENLRRQRVCYLGLCRGGQLTFEQYICMFEKSAAACMLYMCLMMNSCATPGLSFL